MQAENVSANRVSLFLQDGRRVSSTENTESTDTQTARQSGHPTPCHEPSLARVAALHARRCQLGCQRHGTTRLRARGDTLRTTREECHSCAVILLRCRGHHEATMVVC